jgi:hypothetical protein
MPKLKLNEVHCFTFELDSELFGFELNCKSSHFRFLWDADVKKGVGGKILAT